MSKGTILYIGGFELPDKNAAAHRVLNNAKILRDLGYNVVFIDIDRSVKSSSSEQKSKTTQGFDCWSRKYPKSIPEWFSYLYSIKHFKEISSKYNNIKAVICYNYQSYALLKLMNYCRKRDIKVIADCSEWYEDKRIIKRIDTTIRMNYIHKKIDGVICISSYLFKYYNKYTKTVIIPPLVDLQEAKWTENTDRLQLGPDSLHLVYSGTPGKHKDKLNYIIKALSNVNQKYTYSFSVIGITKQQYLDYYPAHSSIIEKLDHCIKFLGRISHEDSLKYVKDADFVVFVREDKRVNNAGFPTKFVESITSGTPVITTKISDLDDYIIEGENGFFVNLNGNITLTLEMILQIDREKINYMKALCKDENPFIYQKHTGKLTDFLGQIGI
ncbi:glycosyltransferase [Paenibacillus sp. CF384]|uniref:glycosyltransferase n=1 Tax=Paenibacillus sp. CF384 TaxID=1884382 RepID=UPI00089B34EF|nr:glycosyltransferase [Paenibacillus sp. CF384]SDX26908.1 Glycosyltransferase involved in cell wall bisynthesis [Paenibacillus sp. CF384]